MENETKKSGYVYSKGTKKGFLRMQRLGIPRPPFRLEDKITRKLRKVYSDFITRLVIDFIDEAKKSNIDFRSGKITTDSAEEVKKALEKAEAHETKGIHNDMTNRAGVQAAAHNLEAKWTQERIDELVREALSDTIRQSLDEGAADFTEKFMQDAGEKMSEIIRSFSIDKKKAFGDNMEALKTLYINSSIERIQGEENELKRQFLKRLTDYAMGKTDTLDVLSLVRQMSMTGVSSARFFARDQMQRFNKAQTLATFIGAGVKSVRWCTCRDSRVRASHKALDGRIFPIDDLPVEIDDYNCRCGLVPAEYYE